MDTENSLSNTKTYKPSEVHLLPNVPGVYKFFNKTRMLIYVGKSKELKKRVASYFNKTTQHGAKTMRMVSQVEEIEFIILNTEYDALLLENILIKEHQPKYNILLKDDKTYPYICILKEHFPRIIYTRRVDKTKGEYFGPFTNLKGMKHVLALLKKIYTIRNCHYNLSPENVESKKYKVCLEYHIGNCLGPCQGNQTENEYQIDIKNARNILKGNLSEVKNFFKEKMAEYSQTLEFEKANEYKLKYENVEKFQSKSVVVNQKITDVDVFTIVIDEDIAFINCMKIENGSIILSDTFEIKKKLDETEEEVLTLAIIQLREKYESKSPEILTNIPVQIETNLFSIHQPKVGDKRHLLDISIKNALFFKKERYNQKIEDAEKEDRVLMQLQSDLKLKTIPRHIECFDNSHIQGSNPVASMVCFKKGKPAKKEYKHFNIKTVLESNDFAYMSEIILRRYTRILEEKQPLPDLIIIDGGKGQLNAAIESLQTLNLYGKVAIMSVAKRLEELYFPNDELPLMLSKKSESLKFIQQIRDEAHRFAINFHRLKRSNAQINTILDEIDGIGEVLKEKLLSHFKSPQKIKEAHLNQLAEAIGPKKAQVVYNFFKNNTQNS
ncbi:MAG: excinuclease ABC subunit UvrC [Chitinophagaceae bacterium]|nr:excinuclease ABC subunit UvrC [Chitinophagaceae bacterium]